MAPQEKTHYGSVEYAVGKPTSGRSATLKFLVGIALVAVAITAAVFAFTSPVRTDVDSTVDLDPREIVGVMTDMKPFDGDDLPSGTDCKCDDAGCDTAEGEVIGECITDTADCIDFTYSAPECTDADPPVCTAKCLVTSGKYDCWSYPCVNKGYCVDQINGYVCVCPFGWMGANCETDIDECGFDGGPLESYGAEADYRPVCSDYSTCLNDDGAYGCECANGFQGDGYAVNQAAVAWGSILTTDKVYGWLDRTGTAGVDYIAGCEDIDDCASNPCFHETLCTDLWATEARSNEFSCTCASTLPMKRWTGEFCEFDVDECTGGLHNCVGIDKATCINGDGSFECSCNTGWEGNAMWRGEYEFGSPATSVAYTEDEITAFTGCTDIDDCAVLVPNDDGTMTETTPCLNGGTCSNDMPGNGLFVCACTSGWEGDLCGVDIDECVLRGEAACTVEFSFCHNTLGSWECRCEDGYTGNPLEHCYDADDCEFSPCANGGTCTDCGRHCAICDCVEGYRGQWCSEDWDECALGIHECHDFGVCINTYGSYECECEAGYSGDGYNTGKCEKVDTCLMYKDYGATCVNGDGESSAQECASSRDCATAPADFVGDWTYTTCDEIDDADLIDYKMRVYTTPDADGVTSLDVAESEKSGIITNAKWMDDYPVRDKNGDKVHMCGIYESDVFAPHGECTDAGPAYICACDEGWTDSNCDLDVNECARGTHECARYAECTNTAGSYTCACIEGHAGEGEVSCNDVDDCTTADPDEMCKNGSCADVGLMNFDCRCAAGWTDSDCGTNIDECALPDMRYYCGLNSQCIDTEGSYDCECKFGYVGEPDGADGCVEIDDCASSPCQHGECFDHGGVGYGCLCDIGWTDSRCDFDVNECVDGTHDCHHTGRCVNTPGSYYCRCVSGFEGDGWTCTDLDDCDPDPCCTEGSVAGTYTNKNGLLVEHNGCIDVGANEYTCNCKRGCEGKHCCDSVMECEKTAMNECDEDAWCTELECNVRDSITMGPVIYPLDPPVWPPIGYECDCKGDFYGDGYHCTPCTVCELEPPAGGWRWDGITGCKSEDRKCENEVECGKTDNCDRINAQCTDTIGSFTCECQGEWYDPQCLGVNCYEMTRCQKGEYMVADGTPCSDRVCAPVIPDGIYALEQGAGSTAQCLVLWAEAAKVFPERYNWGGRNIETDKTAADYVDNADACQNPVCGVCNYNNRDPSENIEIGSVAAWTIAQVWDDSYIVVSKADGKGSRCLGFDQTGRDEIPDPYPRLISWIPSIIEAATGLCVDADEVPTETVCADGTECADDESCSKELVESGSWSTDELGPDGIFNGETRELEYFCGFEDNEYGQAKDKLRSNPQVVWNLHQLGCTRDPEDFEPPRWWCADSEYDMKFVMRSFADQDKLVSGDVPNDSYKAQCIYFPDGNGGQYTHPRRVPVGGTSDGQWMGGNYNGDDNDDHDCGIYNSDGVSQEEALLENKEAVFHIIALNVLEK